MIWLNVGNSDVICDSIPLHSITTVNPGYTTLVFKQTGKKGKEACCFSIISKHRSLDLEADSEDVAKRWVEGLRALLKYSNVMNSSELLKVRKASSAKGVSKRKKETTKCIFFHSALTLFHLNQIAPRILFCAQRTPLED